MVKVERIDQNKSFETVLKFINGNETQEIRVYVWEADVIETALQSLSLSALNQFYTKSGTTTVKEW